jgi:pimeloyl-ACP methyl ester carboxylesterase
MSLNFQTFGESGQSLIIVHGLFGSIANWRSVARELSSDYKVYVVDQRNHGDSNHIDSMTYFDMASDLNEFIEEHQLNDFILCGHSMGGKAAMIYALSGFESVQYMNSMVILDIAPVTYGHSHAPYLQALANIELSEINSRAQVDKLLQPDIVDNATRLFLMQSLERKGDSFRWKLNVPILQKFMPDIVGFPEESVVNRKNNVKVLFLFGSKSEYVTKSMYSLINQFFPNAQFDSVDAGHWLHVEKRQEMLKSMTRFFE